MLHVATVSSKYQISLPKVLRERLGLKPGDHLVVEEHEGSLVLIPAATVPRDQLYFWSKRWQTGEQKAEEDLDAGRTSHPYAPSEVDRMAADLLAREPARRQEP